MLVSGDVSIRQAGRAVPVRVGDVLHLQSSIDFATGTVTLRGRGIVVKASLPEGFPTESPLSLRVVALKPSVRLELLPAESPGPLRSSLPPTISPQNVLPTPALQSSPRDFLIETLLRSLSSARTAAQPALVNHAAVLYRRYFGEPETDRRGRVLLRRARGVLELADRRMEPRLERDSPGGDGDPERSRQLDHLLHWFAGGGGVEERERREERGRSFGASRRDENTGAVSLGDYLCRAVETPDHLLQLFNALAPGEAIHWVVVPIRGWKEVRDSVDDDESEANSLEAVLKIAWHRQKRSPVEAILSVRRSEDDHWWFRWRIDKEGTATTVHLIGSGGEKSAVNEELLARLGYTGHTGQEEKRVSGDGFTLQPADPAPPGGLDTYG